jgi:hypothetical protein
MFSWCLVLFLLQDIGISRKTRYGSCSEEKEEKDGSVGMVLPQLT